MDDEVWQTVEDYLDQNPNEANATDLMEWLVKHGLKIVRVDAEHQ
jgi:hypothetical protein